MRLWRPVALPASGSASPWRSEYALSAKSPPVFLGNHKDNLTDHPSNIGAMVKNTESAKEKKSVPSEP